MTRQEFNDKYSNWIEPGFEKQGLEIDYEPITELLDEIFQGLIKIPEFKYSQIKLKFGSARFYSTLSFELQLSVEQAINNIIRKNEDNINTISL